MSNTIQMTLLFPLVFGVLLATLQWAMISWADATALAAAQDAARITAAHNSTTTAGNTAATTAADNGSLSNIHITIQRGATATTATITGTALTVIPGFHHTIAKTAQAPTQRITQS